MQNLGVPLVDTNVDVIIDIVMRFMRISTVEYL